jgi:hypothetical protein
MSFWSTIDIDITFITCDINESKSWINGRHVVIGTLPKLGYEASYNDSRYKKLLLEWESKPKKGNLIHRGNAWCDGDFQILSGSEGPIQYTPELIDVKESYMTYFDEEDGERFCECFYPFVKVSSVSRLRDFRIGESGSNVLDQKRDTIDAWIKNVFDENWLFIGNITIESDSESEKKETYVFITSFLLESYLVNNPNYSLDDFNFSPSSFFCIKLSEGKSEILHQRHFYDDNFILMEIVENMDLSQVVKVFSKSLDKELFKESIAFRKLNPDELVDHNDMLVSIEDGMSSEYHLLSNWSGPDACDKSTSEEYINTNRLEGHTFAIYRQIK